MEKDFWRNTLFTNMLLRKIIINLIGTLFYFYNFRDSLLGTASFSFWVFPHFSQPFSGSAGNFLGSWKAPVFFRFRVSPVQPGIYRAVPVKILRFFRFNRELFGPFHVKMRFFRFSFFLGSTGCPSLRIHQTVTGLTGSQLFFKKYSVAPCGANQSESIKIIFIIQNYDFKYNRSLESKSNFREKNNIFDKDPIFRHKSKFSTKIQFFDKIQF